MPSSRTELITRPATFVPRIGKPVSFQPSGFTLEDHKLKFTGRDILFDVPPNVVFSPYSCLCSDNPILSASSASRDGGFLGFNANTADSRHVISLGKLRGINFTAIFRFKLWWTTQWVGNKGSDLETETQMLLLDTHGKAASEGINGYPYVLMLPIYEGKFRASLQAGNNDNVDVCVESGSTLVRASSFKSCVYLHACHDPFLLVKEAVKALSSYLGTFKLLEEKVPPSIIDKFGWCTWDAFYLTVHPEGIWNGVKSFVEGGVPPKFIIIDDGWQSISFDHQDPSEDATGQTIAGDQMWCRLTKIEANGKFKSYAKGALPTKDPKKSPSIKDLNDVAVCNGVPHKDRSNMVVCNGAPHRELTDVAVCNGAPHKNHGGVVCFNGATDNDVPHKDQSNMVFCKRAPHKELSNPVVCDGAPQENHGCMVCFNGAPDKGSQRGLIQHATQGLGAFLSDLKERYNSLDDVYVWHALAGYWGGVRPGLPDSFNAELVQPVLAPGLRTTMEDLAVDKLVTNTIGLVPPENAQSFYDKMHSCLAWNGVTGVKVDVMHVLELLGEKYGGRMELCRAYYKALAASIRKNLGGNRVIASMEHCNDFMLTGTEQISFGRVGDDFWTEDANGDPLLWLQGLHLVHCAYNSVWMGQFIRPDWDMFQTTHPAAAMHAAARAISGGPIYVSDKPHKHDFGLLRRLVYPDGTIPRCVHFALPTRDCLFLDAAHDGKSILKIWNFNKFGAVVGAFNCQGGGWSRVERRNAPSPQHKVPCSTFVSPRDIEWKHAHQIKAFAAKSIDKVEDFVVYSMKSDKLTLMKKDEGINVQIDPLEYDIYTVSPLQEFFRGTQFAAIGLLNMVNSGGCMKKLDFDEVQGSVFLQLHGGGQFGAYGSFKPKACKLNGVLTGFAYAPWDGRIVVEVPWEKQNSTLEFFFS